MTPAPRALSSGTTVVIVSGEDDAPVEGARVILAGREYLSDADGRVRLDEDVPYGSLVDVIADGFFSRQTVVPSDATTRFSLWPRETASGMNEEFTAQLVYTSGRRGDQREHGTSPLERLRKGFEQVFVWISEDLQSDPRAHQMHQSAVDEINASIEGRAVYTLTTTRETRGILVEAKMSPPGDESCAAGAHAYFLAWLTGNGEIARGEIVYCRRSAARTSTVTHELGHSVGLQHSYGREELMSPYYSSSTPDHFSSREALAMRLLFERPAGNRFPDTDREVTAFAGGVLRTICY